MLDRIRACVPALPPAEQRVARLLLADARGFATLPVAELAARAQVSKPTVVRFCRSVGYDGLADFKLKLAAGVNDGAPVAARTIGDADTAAEVADKVVDQALAALLRHRQAAAPQALERATAALAAAAREGRRIEFYGLGPSGIVALDAQHRFLGLGLRCAASCDTHVQVMSATQLGRGDCAVLICGSGRSAELLDVADLAQRKGALLIAITASASPLALRAQRRPHVLLAADAPEDAAPLGPALARLLHLVVIDTLTTAVALRLGGAQLRPRLAEMRENLRLRRYAPARGGGSASGSSGSSSSTP
jgi:RpiR family carbohydrate utilization transcriptional regulator